MWLWCSRMDPITVLLVDDHEMFIEGVSRVLAADGAFDIVAVAATAERGVAMAAAYRPAVAVVDYVLPDGDGATTTQGLLAASPTTKVVILTGRTDEKALIAAIEAGSSGFVTKDNPVSELIKAIRSVLDGEAYITPRMLSVLLPRLGNRPQPVGTALSARELEVLELVAEGLSNDAIAKRLFLSVNTVRNHVQNLLTKLGAHSKLEAMVIARREGLVDGA